MKNGRILKYIVNESVSRLGFDDPSALDAAGADHFARDSALNVDFDTLKVGGETTQRFADDLGTGTTSTFDLTASFVFHARLGCFSADNTSFRHTTSLLGK